MTKLSPLSASLLQMLTAGGKTSSGTAQAAAQSALEHLQGASATPGTASDNPLQTQTQVTLSSRNGATDSSAVTTYNAKGLLNRIQSSQPSNPLFAIDSSTSGSGDSLLGAVAGAGANGVGTAAASDPVSSANLLQLFKQSPSFAAAYVQGQVTQSIFSKLS